MKSQCFSYGHSIFTSIASSEITQNVKQSKLKALSARVENHKNPSILVLHFVWLLCWRQKLLDSKVAGLKSCWPQKLLASKVAGAKSCWPQKLLAPKVAEIVRSADKTPFFGGFLPVFCPVFRFFTDNMYMTRIFFEKIGPSLFFLAAGTTDTKVRRSTGVTTANSTNKYQKYKSVELGDQLQKNMLCKKFLCQKGSAGLAIPTFDDKDFSQTIVGSSLQFLNGRTVGKMVETISSSSMLLYEGAHRCKDNIAWL